MPARALQENQVALRLSLEEMEEMEEMEESEEDGNLAVFLKKIPGLTNSETRWSLKCEEKVWQLDEMSLNALRAAEDFHFKAYHGETEVPLNAAEINVERTKLFLDVESEASVTTLRVLLKAPEESNQLGMDDLTDEAARKLANLLALLEVDYGLFALNLGRFSLYNPPIEFADLL